MNKVSLIRQLTGGILVAELVCAGLLCGTAVLHERNDRQHAFDVMLRGRADSLMGAVQDAEDPDDSVFVDPSEVNVPAKDMYAVLGPTGRVLGSSDNVSPVLLTGGAPRSPEYFSMKENGEGYRVVRFAAVRVVDREKNGGIRRPVTVVYGSPTEHLWSEVLEAVRFYILASVLFLAITGVALVWFLRRRLSPLEELAEIASNVSTRSWDFVPPQEVLHTAELAPIARSIQKLLAGLRQAFERQRQLTGDAAHELKTSIAVMKSSLQLLTLAPRTAGEYEAGLEGLIADTDRMQDLATRMLALARLEEAPPDEPDSIDLCTVLAGVISRLRPSAELRGINLELSGPAGSFTRMHPEDADVLVSNLVVNALQHSGSAGRIEVTVAPIHGNLELHVKDSGEGIPETALPHIFERFYRADRSRSRNSGGAGLGLSICKAIVERAHGSIEVRSQVGLGTEVIVTLPASEGHGSTPEVPEHVELAGQ